MEVIDFVQTEKRNLFMEVKDLKNHLHQLYKQKGPASSEYITLSIKLNLLIKEYFED